MRYDLAPVHRYSRTGHRGQGLHPFSRGHSALPPALGLLSDETRGRLAGRTCVFTGGLQTMTRDEAKELAEKLGAKTAGSVSKKVTDVVAGADAGSKLEKAQALGLRILDEEAFRTLVGAQ